METIHWVLRFEAVSLSVPFQRNFLPPTAPRLELVFHLSTVHRDSVRAVGVKAVEMESLPS